MSESAAPPSSSPCQSCGACCDYSSTWPRFSTEDDDVLELIPNKLVNKTQSGMRCVEDRCAALAGEVGKATACSIYDIRPDVCRACLPGDEACNIARKHHGLPAIE